MKIRHPIVLSSCLGFVVGFAVCLCWRFQSDDEPTSETDSLSARVQNDPASVVESYESLSSNTSQQPNFFGAPITPRVFRAEEDWKVTIWYQSLPPQRGETFDPRESAAKRMGLTNK
ncbi:MAG TPA: hypothetical protein VFZ59_05455 [Verrucomicrobiae bacterium]|nr:hypothetical protein [Verrucomicrobiae bacterium]